MVGGEGGEEKIVSMDESSLVIFLDSFDQINLANKSLGSLMNYLSKNNELVQEIENGTSSDSVFDQLHPCRPFQKMNIISLLAKRLKSKGTDIYLKERINKSLLNFFEMELKYDVSLSQLNMTLNLMSSIAKDSILFDENEVEKILINLEDEFDKIVDKAELQAESNDVNKEENFNANLLNDELTLSRIFKNRMKMIIKKSFK